MKSSMRNVLFNEHQGKDLSRFNESPHKTDNIQENLFYSGGYTQRKEDNEPEDWDVDI